MSVKKRTQWGGARPGAGRPKGSGSGPSPHARRNRIAVMVSDMELERLETLARLAGKPVATVAHEIVASGLRRKTRPPSR